MLTLSSVTADLSIDFFARAGVILKKNERNNIIRKSSGGQSISILKIKKNSNLTGEFYQFHIKITKIPKSTHLSYGANRQIADTRVRTGRYFGRSCTRGGRVSSTPLYIWKKWDIVLAEFARGGAPWNRIPRSRSSEKWVEIRWSTKKYMCSWMLPRRSHGAAPPERPWDRRRPSRTIYKPAVPTSSPGSLVLFSFRSSLAAPFLRLWGSRFFTPRLILRMNLRETSSHHLLLLRPLLFLFLPRASASHRPIAVPTPREIAEREAASPYRDWILFLRGAFY